MRFLICRVCRARIELEPDDDSAEAIEDRVKEHNSGCQKDKRKSPSRNSKDPLKKTIAQTADSQDALAQLVLVS